MRCTCRLFFNVSKYPFFWWEGVVSPFGKMGGDHFQAVALLVRRFQRGSKGTRGTVLEREERDRRGCSGQGAFSEGLRCWSRGVGVRGLHRQRQSRRGRAGALEAPSAVRSWKAASDRSHFLPGDVSAIVTLRHRLCFRSCRVAW